MRVETRRLPEEPDVIAPDGSEVRLLLDLAGGGMAHFRLPAGQVSVAVHHASVEEIWYVLSGRGELWRGDGRDGADGAARAGGAAEEVVPLEPGTSVTIPLGVHFQFRSLGPGPLDFLGITMPPWPGEGEARRSEGPWPPTARPGPGLAEGG